jgi:hypothetical protein
MVKNGIPNFLARDITVKFICTRCCRYVIDNEHPELREHDCRHCEVDKEVVNYLNTRISDINLNIFYEEVIKERD